MEKTYVIKGKPEANWVLIDAEGETLGRLATRIAATLMGKHKPDFTPGATMGDSVIVINAKGIQANPTRVKEKIYYRHSNYPGGLKAVTYTDQIANHPDRIIKIAVKGMLPKGPLGRKMITKLHVYAGPEHPHAAQKPEVLELKY